MWTYAIFYQVAAAFFVITTYQPKQASVLPVQAIFTVARFKISFIRIANVIMVARDSGCAAGLAYTILAANFPIQTSCIIRAIYTSFPIVNNTITTQRTWSAVVYNPVWLISRALACVCCGITNQVVSAGILLTVTIDTSAAFTLFAHIIIIAR
jgi:hypothetical protein